MEIEERGTSLSGGFISCQRTVVEKFVKTIWHERDKAARSKSAE